MNSQICSFRDPPRGGTTVRMIEPTLEMQNLRGSVSGITSKSLLFLLFKLILNRDGDTKLKDTQDPLNIMKEATYELDKRSKVSKPIRSSHKMSKREKREEKERQRARQL